MNKTAFLFIIIAILGVYLMGKGITGLVVSESCCFPPDCDDANLCDAATESFSRPLGSYFFIIFGIGLVAIAIGSLIWRKHPLDI
ncbi:hypothetical protein JW851_01010 [Candidatus Woesearchaeota archaeon]|nr:hypothetical protein [Candidatus Woesearchaeota archaeon]